jgi:hypothetical protein
MKDNEAVYDAEISPLVTKLIEICQKHDLPMFASFAFAEGQRCTTFVCSPEASESVNDFHMCRQLVFKGFASAIVRTSE